MTRQILVPLDGSSLAEAVLPCAVALARTTSSNLTLLRVVPPLTLIEPIGAAINRGDDFWQTYQHEPDTDRQYLISKAVSLGLDELTLQTGVMEGEPATCILEYASANPDVQFIAMATHGRSGLGRLFFGSVAERVLHASPVPVLMLRSHAGDNDLAERSTLGRPFGHILVPLDGSELGEASIELARRLAAATDARITLLSIAPGPSLQELANPTLLPLWVEGSQDEKLRQLDHYLLGVAQQLRGEGFKVKTLVKPGHPAEEIILAGDQNEVDLIVMAAHGRSELQRLWLGSVASTVVQGTARPVLLVRAGKPLAETHAARIERGAR